MLRKTPASLLFAVSFSLHCFAQGPSVAPCIADLESLPGFLLENDAGARDHLAQFGQKHFDDALAEARTAASQIRGNASCAPVLNKYLRAWRRGHLSVEDIPGASNAAAAPRQPAPQTPPQNPEDAPAIEILSAKTLRLTLKSFQPWNREPLAALIAAHRADLESHPNWIVDVRGNPGGSDSSYFPLRPWLMPDEIVDANTEVLATPANIEGWTHACALLAPGDTECEKSLSGGIERMRNAAPGTYVNMGDGARTSYYRVDRPEPHRPSRVAIFIDGGCGSTCEQFAIDARQSFSVRLVGQHTYGSLDYSNVRPHDLPSGRRRLMYATTRSTRIPGLMVDVVGVQPDVYLPVEAGNRSGDDEVLRVQSWLEGGTLAPSGAK
ncbi:MAG TPA: S41 family peptidase [Bryobacteraceae bacterium]|nr:S41 family peptidase [Bryobacteraceae bacterium]